ncbi:glycoside hydrolase family 11 protein [Treponema zuelzerae]|uniref:endo-1,4-beta-xylanase n=1 Tax=Teretinema zuelzerae TaxID=156 RepID=A0AAE3JJ16_9SPIR|nr:glycoside hydrolase family 11 protein [Teretinema zuelzerae]MCD1653740.1 glycoside hydrolase family 11 protein [Teretinema zuelzerae]
MSIKKCLFTALAGVALGASLTWGQDYSTWTSSTIRNCNGIDYELWNQDNVGTSIMKITGGSSDPNGGTFEAQWNGTINVLFRAGKKWGASSTTTPRDVGKITVDFAATWSSTDDVKMLGIYGWAYYPARSKPKKTEKNENATFSNQIEYYIIQDRGSFNPASGGRNAKRYGSGTIDGIEYEFWVADRLNEAMLTGKGNFKQYFSVPKNTSSHRQSGKVSVSKHFEAWDKAGMKMMDCPLYEVAMKVESYSGKDNTGRGKGNGSAKVTKNLLTFGGSTTVDELSLISNVSPSGAGSVTKTPDKSSYAPNTSVELTATPNTGWRFIGWDGDATGSATSTTVSMSENRSVTAKFALVSGEGTANLIKDGDFPTSSVIAENDAASWRLGQGEYWGDSEASTSVSNGMAAINVTTIGAESYQPQLVQYGLGLDQGMMYKLTFKAKAESERRIEVSFQQSANPWASYASQEFDLTSSEQDYEFVFTMTNESDPASQFAFNLGQATGVVSISQVKLVHTTAGRFKSGTKENPESSCEGGTKMNDNDFALLVDSIKEAGKIQRGHQKESRRFEMNAPDIRAIREHSNKTQADFAYMIGVSVATLRNWEQGRRKPEGPALALLKIVSKNPEYVEQILTV